MPKVVPGGRARHLRSFVCGFAEGTSFELQTSPVVCGFHPQKTGTAQTQAPESQTTGDSMAPTRKQSQTIAGLLSVPLAPMSQWCRGGSCDFTF